MRKLFVFLTLAFIVPMSGCYTLRQGENVQQYSNARPAMLVRVINNCAPNLDIEGASGTIRSNLGFGESFTVVLARPLFGSGQMILVVKGAADGKYLGSVSKTFNVNSSQGARETPWEINRLSLGNNGRNNCLTR